MAEHALTTPTVAPRRVPLAELGEGRRPVVLPLFARSGEMGISSTDTLRAQLEALITDALDMLDDLDGDTNLEPDADGEAEPEEASAQPLTLAPDRANVVQMPRRLRHVEGITSSAPIDWASHMPPVVHRPSVAQMRRAYRETGAAVPANLRFDIFGRART
jgi:hypothetical protein